MSLVPEQETCSEATAPCKDPGQIDEDVPDQVLAQGSMDMYQQQGKLER